MKITAQEEYGLRILIRIARCADEDGLSIPQISEAEGLTQTYSAKLTRCLRLAGFINSTPGQKGGYILAKPQSEIIINHVLKALGGEPFSDTFCGTHSGSVNLCTNSVDCSARSLWRMVQYTLDNLLNQVTLADLCAGENTSREKLYKVLFDKPFAVQE